MTQAANPSAARRTAGALLFLSASTCALAIFQWLELLRVRHGGAAICTINQTINCETVWNSVLATRVHDVLHVPVAALGLIWGVTALLQAARLWKRSAGGEARPVRAPLRLLSVVGVLACLLFGLGSLQVHALCLTCLGTYLLVLAFALVTFLGLRGAGEAANPDASGGAKADAPAEVPARTLVWTAGVAFLVYLALLVPGSMTPRSSADLLAQVPAVQPPPPQAAGWSASSVASASGAPPANLAPAAPAAPAATTQDAPNVKRPTGAAANQEVDAETALRVFLSLMNPQEKTELAMALADYRAAEPPTEALAFPQRVVAGDPHALVRLLDFTDIQCPHCRDFHTLLMAVRSKLPPNALAIESRYFPLDSSCNEALDAPPPPEPSVRCFAAKAQVCLERDPHLLDLQTQLFAEQQTLTNERVLQIASTGSLTRKQLEACIAMRSTQLKITEDVRLAALYQIKGTPLVVINGRPVDALPSLLFVLGLTGGDANVPELVALSQPASAAVAPH